MREFKRKQAEHPYSDYWLYIVWHKSEGRRMANLILKSDTRIRTTIAYARYLMSVKLGRLLSKDEHVDHINGDKTDDRLDNFQILSSADNTRKAVVEQGKSAKLVEFICGVCGNIFYRTRNRAYRKLILEKDLSCSVECGRIAAYSKTISNSDISNRFRKITEEQIEVIRKLKSEGKSSYEISKITSFARNTVMKYWKT